MDTFLYAINVAILMSSIWTANNAVENLTCGPKNIIYLNSLTATTYRFGDRKNPYPIGISCTFIFKVLDPGEIMLLEFSPQCSFGDVLKANDEFNMCCFGCRSAALFYENSVMVSFTSDWSTSARELGFDIKIITGKDEANCSASNTSVTVGTSILRITSPNFPHIYPTSMNCSYIISSQDSGKELSLVFQVIGLDAEDQCYDTITIGLYNRSVVQICTNYTKGNIFIPYIKYTSEGPIYLHFHSDESISGYGFRVLIIQGKDRGWCENCKLRLCDDTENCIQGCVNGYWGPACNTTCPVNCKDMTCNRFTGHCASCLTGFWEAMCESVCSYYCIGSLCDKTTGNCTQGCKPGRYGGTCDKTCSYQCLGRTCDQQNATCSNGCIQNWTGQLCDVCDSTHYGYRCSLPCSLNCINSTCNNVTGSCTFGCKIGFYGEKCRNYCTGCLTGCRRITGLCNGECVFGQYGEFCDKTCNLRCKDGCNSETGFCYNCTDKKYGDMCNKDCIYCPTGCDKNTGECINDCPIGRFGSMCDKWCNALCGNGCLRESGICRNGCINGTFGYFCNETCVVSSSQDTEKLEGYILYGVIAVLGISLVFNGCVIIWILRHNACKRQNVQGERSIRSNTNHSISPQEIYDRVDDVPVYHELGQLSGPSYYNRLMRHRMY